SQADAQGCGWAEAAHVANCRLDLVAHHRSDGGAIFTVTAEVDGQRGYTSLSQGDGDAEHVLLGCAIGRDQYSAALRGVRRKKVGRNAVAVGSGQCSDALHVHGIPQFLTTLPRKSWLRGCGKSLSRPAS